MKRIFVLALLAVATVAGSALAQTFPGPSSPTQARIYFYRTADIATASPVRWTGVFMNDQKVGDLGASTYFYRDVPPGSYRLSVSSDLPYQDQLQNITVAANSTTFVRVFNVPGYGAQVRVTGGLPQLIWPSVFGNRVTDPAVAQAQMVGLTPVQ
jgi:Protein of unknown function (DUF2846)